MTTPIATSLTRIDPARDWLGAAFGPAPDGWIRCDRLSTDPMEAERLRSAVIETFGSVDQRTDGVMMMWRYADVARVATLVFALDRRVLDLRPDLLAFDPGTNERPVAVAWGSRRFWCLRDDEAADHPDAIVLAAVNELRRQLVTNLESYIAPVVPAMQAATRLGPRALWGIGATVPLVAVAHAFAELGDPDGGAMEVEAILRDAGPLAMSPPSFQVFAALGARHLAIRDGACCRAYRREGGELCLSCPVLDQETRIAQQLRSLEARQTETGT